MTSASARFIHRRATREPDGRVPAHGHHASPARYRRHPARSRRRGRPHRTAPYGLPVPQPARGGIGIINDMTATTPGAAGPSTGNPGTVDGPDRASRAAAARLLTRDAAVHWLTETTVAGIG